MEDIKQRKIEIRDEVIAKQDSLSESEKEQINTGVTGQLFDFANFVEAKIALLYLKRQGEVPTEKIIERCHALRKIIILPVFDKIRNGVKLYKVDNFKTDLLINDDGVLEPNPKRCKIVPIDCLDIAVIPGIGFDEKGGRVGQGTGSYDRLIPKLPMTTRKISLAYEFQIVKQVPMESSDKHIDIIITENRVIYKI